MTKKRSIIALTLAVLLIAVIAIVGTMKHGDAATVSVNLSASGNTSGLVIDADTYTFAGSTKSYTAGTEFIVTGKHTVGAYPAITVSDGVSANITLSGVTVTSLNQGVAGILIAPNSVGNVTITIADGTTNTITGGASYAAIQKCGVGDDVGTLTINGGTLGTGKLIATGGNNAAGIGAWIYGGTRNIVINGGIITAKGGGEQAAGIGTGYFSHDYQGYDSVNVCSDITINGGTVTAIGATNAAGIGGGTYTNTDNIVINGGAVLATGTGNAAGIGGGASSTIGTTTINGGVVTATSGASGYDSIGAGGDATVEAIVINGGSVLASNGMGVTPRNNDGTYVYRRDLANPNSLPVLVDGNIWNVANHKALDSSDTYLHAWIPNASTIALQGTNPTEIPIDISRGGLIIDEDTYIFAGTTYSYVNGTEFVLSGSTNQYNVTVIKDVDANVTFNGVSINLGANPDTPYPAFDIQDESNGDVRIMIAANTTNNLTGGWGYAAIQNGKYSSSTTGTLSIDGEDDTTSKLFCYSNNESAAIGGGTDETGRLRSTRNLYIYGGYIYIPTGVTSNGNTYNSRGACIGAGIGGNAYNMKIYGGTITAYASNEGSAAIGSAGTASNVYNLYIYGGTITADSGKNAAAIGSGTTGVVSGLYIYGGDIKAYGGQNGAGIGTGATGNATYIGIYGGNVYAWGGLDAAGIGTGGSGTAKNIAIRYDANGDGNITVTAIGNGGTTSTTVDDIGNGVYNSTEGSTSNIYINSGSVKATTMGCTPTSTSNGTTTVVKHTIANPNNKVVRVNGVEWTPRNHTALDSSDTNLYAWYPSGQTYTLGPINPTVTAPTAKTLTYNGSEQTLINAGSTTGGTIQYKLSTATTWSSSLPKATDAGTYTVQYKVVGDGEYWNSIGAKTVTVTIAKAASSVTKAPTAKTLTYSGSAQALVDAGTASGGTMNYAVTTTTTAPAASAYSESIPTRTNAGTYYVWYKVVGDSNHTDLTPNKNVTVKIDKKAQSAPTGLTANAETIYGKADGTISSLTTSMQYSLDGGTTWKTVTDPTMTFAAGTVKVRKAATTNYNASSAVTLTIAAGEYLEIIIDSQTGVTATSTSDLTKIPYKGGATLTVELATGFSKTSQFAVKVNGTAVTVDSNNQFTISGMTADAVVTFTGVADLNPPVIEGVENGGSYYVTQEVTVTDDNLTSVTVNGTDYTSKIPFTIAGDKDATYTIVAKDAGGNIVTYKVTMQPIETVAEPIDGMTPDNVTEKDIPTIQGVLEEALGIDTDDATDDEKAEVQAIIDKCIELLAAIPGGMVFDMSKGSLVIYDTYFTFGDHKANYEAGMEFILTGSTDKYTVTVKNGVDANITLKGVSIKLPATPVSGASGVDNEGCALLIEDDSAADVTITIADDTTNTLQSSKLFAGLQKSDSNDKDASLAGTLTIQGDVKKNGILNAIGRSACGIGSKNNYSVKKIVIDSGVINASVLSGNGSGIGGYNNVNGITINGGTINATGGDYGAGIGAGSNAFSITINGGNIVATGSPNVKNGAGIGGYNVSGLYIYGGNITAKGGSGAAGIGGEDAGYVRYVGIYGGVINAIGGDNASGIGTGGGGASASSATYSHTINITGGTITATAGECTISGATVKPDDIGVGVTNKGTKGEYGAIYISGGSVKAKTTAVEPLVSSKDKTVVVLHEINNPEGKVVFVNGKIWTPSNHTALDANDTTLYAWAPADAVIELGPIDPTVTAPKANDLEYTGKAQELVTPGSTTGGTIMYSTDGKTWTEDIPKATEAGDYTVYYKVVGDGEAYNDVPAKTVEVTIEKGTQAAPSGLVFGNESAAGKADGTIAGLTTGMEYSTDGGKTWNPVTNPGMTFGPGEVQVRYPETDDYAASEPVVGTIGTGDYITITVADVAGVTVESDSNFDEITYGDDVTFTVEIADGYEKTEDFKVLVDGKEIAPNADGSYTIADVVKDSSIVVSGVNKVVAESTTIYCKAAYQAYLIEPWAMRVTVRFTDVNGTTIDVSTLQDYGVYAIRAGQLDALSGEEEVTIQDIINDPDSLYFGKSDVEGEGMWATGDGRAIFGFDDGLFTYRLSEEVYWVAYCKDANGKVHYMDYKSKSLHAIAESLVAASSTNTYIKAILEDMLVMEEAIVDYRSDFDNLTDLEPSNPNTVGNCGIDFGTASTDGKYAIGNKYRVSLIEPWSIRLIARIYDTTDDNTSSTDHIDYSTADDYGVIVFQDIDGTHGNMTSYEDLLALEGAYVYSKSQGNMETDPLDSNCVSAAYDQDIFTYQLDKNIYCVSFVEIDGQFYYSKLLTRNMLTFMSDSLAANSGSEKLLKVYDAMIEMYESVKAYHESL